MHRRLKTWIGSLPVSMSISHYYPLKGSQSLDLRTKDAWDAARESVHNFALPQSHDEWLRLIGDRKIEHDGLQWDLVDRAACVHKIALGVEAKSICSFGVGMAGLEHYIGELQPKLPVLLSEFSQVNVDWLKQVAGYGDAARSFDLRQDRLSDVFPEVDGSGLLLLHRIDPCLNDPEWQEVFEGFSDSAVKYVLFVPHVMLSARYLWNSKMRECKSRIVGCELALSGLVRTRKRWLALFGSCFEVIDEPNVGGAKGFLLRTKTTLRRKQDETR